MTVELIVYTLAVGSLLAATARAAEGLCRLAGRPSRWVWAFALLFTVILPALAPLRAERRQGSAAAFAGAETGAVSVGIPAQPAWREALSSKLAAIRGGLETPVRSLFDAAARRSSPALERFLLWGWLAATGASLLVLATVYIRIHRERRNWPITDLFRTRVRVARDAGPAVIGLFKNEIVVPHWLLLRDPDEQRLVLAHEREHVTARDPLLLGVACVTAALVPWHPLAWWMLSRLRLAVELDCDNRVLRRGVTPKCYGALLIDLAGQCSHFPVGAAPLADETSHLELRLLAMTQEPTRFVHARRAVLGALALVSLATACDTRLPTSAEINAMDVASAERSARSMGFEEPGDSQREYLVDGVRVTAAEAVAVDPERIATIEVVRTGKNGERPRVNITTRRGDAVPGNAASVRPDAASPARGRQATDALERNDTQFMTSGFKGLILIDGVPATMAAVHALDRASIETVEVIKSAAATSLYPAPGAANGVIRITTRNQPDRK